MCAQECRLCYCGIFSGYLFETGGIHLSHLRYLSVLMYAHDILDPPCPSLKGRELSSPFSGPPKISDFGVSFWGDRGGLSNQIQFGAGNQHAGCLPFFHHKMIPNFGNLRMQKMFLPCKFQKKVVLLQRKNTLMRDFIL